MNGVEAVDGVKVVNEVVDEVEVWNRDEAVDGVKVEVVDGIEVVDWVEEWDRIELVVRAEAVDGTRL